MMSFLDTLVVGCKDEQVVMKVQGLMAQLVHAHQPWCLDRSSGLWLDISDLQHMSITFPLVVWGLETGRGVRRVMYPPHANGLVEPAEASRIASSRGQFILDSAHFFPLDEVMEDTSMGLLEASARSQMIGISSQGAMLSPISTTEGVVHC